MWSKQKRKKIQQNQLPQQQQSNAQQLPSSQNVQHNNSMINTHPQAHNLNQQSHRKNTNLI